MVSSKSTTIGGGRAKFAIFLICLIGEIGLTLASQTCRNTVSKVLTEQCGYTEQRSRRATGQSEQTDLFKGVFETIIPTLAEIFTNAAGKAMAESFPAYSSAMKALRSHSNKPAATGEHSDKSRARRRSAPYQLNSLPSSMEDDLGLDLTIEEVEGLYSDIFEKTDRQSSITPDAAKDLFFDIAAKCCRNEDTCLGEINIDCP